MLPRQADGSTKTLPQFASEVEEKLRLALLIALDAASGMDRKDTLIDWEEVVLQARWGQAGSDLDH